MSMSHSQWDLPSSPPCTAVLGAGVCHSTLCFCCHSSPQPPSCCSLQQSGSPASTVPFPGTTSSILPSPTPPCGLSSALRSLQGFPGSPSQTLLKEWLNRRAPSSQPTATGPLATGKQTACHWLRQQRDSWRGRQRLFGRSFSRLGQTGIKHFLIIFFL